MSGAFLLYIDYSLYFLSISIIADWDNCYATRFSLSGAGFDDSGLDTSESAAQRILKKAHLQVVGKVGLLSVGDQVKVSRR